MPFQEDFSSPFIPAQTHSADFNFQGSSCALPTMDLDAMDFTGSLFKGVDLLDEYIDDTKYLQEESFLHQSPASQVQPPIQTLADVGAFIEAAPLPKSGGVSDPVWNYLENTGDTSSQFVPERGHEASSFSDMPSPHSFTDLTVPPASDALFYDTPFSMNWLQSSVSILEGHQTALGLEPPMLLDRLPRSECAAPLAKAAKHSLPQSTIFPLSPQGTQLQAKPKAIQPKPTISSSENLKIYTLPPNAPITTPATKRKRVDNATKGIPAGNCFTFSIESSQSSSTQDAAVRKKRNTRSKGVCLRCRDQKIKVCR